MSVYGTLIVHENCCVFHHPNENFAFHEPPERVECDIKSFSAKARKRMFQYLSMLRYSSYSLPLFVSCTFHHDSPDTRADLKYLLRKFYNRLTYQLPAFKIFWKLEYQERGVPHFHFMFLFLDKSCSEKFDSISAEIKRAWYALKTCKCKHCKKYHTDVRIINDYKHALIYISKELAKVQDRYEDHNLGRIWGHSNNMNFDHLYKIDVPWELYQQIVDKKLEEDFRSELQKNLLRGLKYIERTSSIFINYTDILHLIKPYVEKESKESDFYSNLKTLKLKKRSNHVYRSGT